MNLDKLISTSLFVCLSLTAVACESPEESDTSSDDSYGGHGDCEDDDGPVADPDDGDDDPTGADSVPDGPSCEDTCPYANDGECDDGGPGSEYSVCGFGTDCGDCGSRGGGGDDPGSDDGGVASGCEDVEDEIDGSWITPHDADVASGFYARLTLDAATGTGEVAQYASGASQITPIAAWKIEGADCDELHVDYGTGYLTDYSEILELTNTNLELVATDGSYYGQQSRYRRE